MRGQLPGTVWLFLTWRSDVATLHLWHAGLPTTLTQARREYQGLLLSQAINRAQQSLGGKLAGDWVERFERDRAEAFHRDLEPVSGAARAVQRVKDASIPVCVASQGSFEKTRLTLVGYAADSDETALRNAGAEIVHKLTDLPDMLAI